MLSVVIVIILKGTRFKRVYCRRKKKLRMFKTNYNIVFLQSKMLIYSMNYFLTIVPFTFLLQPFFIDEIKEEAL